MRFDAKSESLIGHVTKRFLPYASPASGRYRQILLTLKQELRALRSPTTRQSNHPLSGRCIRKQPSRIVHHSNHRQDDEENQEGRRYRQVRNEVCHYFLCWRRACGWRNWGLRWARERQLIRIEPRGACNAIFLLRRLGGVF